MKLLPNSHFLKDEGGAVAATYALALMGLVAVAGVGFDYGRLMMLESELQNAADAAALAAATQLDGKGGAISRAQGAVNNYFANAASAVVNRTLVASTPTGTTTALTGVSFTFYQSYDGATDAFGAVATADANAKVARVTINPREVFYALTPIVGLLRSGGVSTDAVAGLESGKCKIPPMMVCAPNASFPSDSDVGRGILLQPGVQNAWGPGMYGYVDIGSGANDVKAAMGGDFAGDYCDTGTGLDPQNGNEASATQQVNSRFDIYKGSAKTSDCVANGDYCPAASTRKDVVKQEVYFYKDYEIVGAATGPARPACNANPAGATKTVSDWVELPANVRDGTNDIQGFPRDDCHISATDTIGNCGGTQSKFGDKAWNRTGYVNAHPGVPNNLVTRYDYYKWELANRNTNLVPTLANTSYNTDGVTTPQTFSKTNCRTVGGKGNPRTVCDFTWTNYCSYPTAVDATTANSPPKDRRILTVAVADCTGGRNHFPVQGWMDVFLVQPALDRNVSYQSSNTQLYVEVIGPATRPDGTNAFQYFSRNKAVLLR